MHLAKQGCFQRLLPLNISGFGINEIIKLIAQQNPSKRANIKILLEGACLYKKLCYDENCLIRSCVQSGYLGG